MSGPTKAQSDFIGTTFPTPKGGVLTVVGVAPKVKGKERKYVLECSICSLDRELFNIPFTSWKGSLEKGQLPCGCTNKVYWNKQQYVVRLRRECDKRGYEFLGFDEQFKGSKTRLKLHNIKNGNKWSTTRISGLFLGKGCPVEGIVIRSSKRLKTVQSLSKKILSTGKFIKGTTFSRSNKTNGRGGKAYLDRYCPKCSNDVYVKQGLCKGVFTSAISMLKKGELSCRCSNIYRYTKEQQELRLTQMCNGECLKFVSLPDYTKKSESKFNWVCSKSHSCSTSIHEFLQGTRCKQCFQENSGFYGYYKDRANEPDQLYIIKDGLHGIIKVGRSFDYSRRIKEITKASGLDWKLVKIVDGDHQTIYNLEQALHSKYNDHSVNREGALKPNDGSINYYSIEIFYDHILPDVLNSLP